MKFIEIGRFAGDAQIAGTVLTEIALVKETTSGDFGICVYQFDVDITPRDATVFSCSQSELSQLKTLIDRGLDSVKAGKGEEQ